MRLRSVLALGALVASSACGSDTTALLRLKVQDCSLDPARIASLLYVLEPADRPDFPGVTEPRSVVDDGVSVSLIDVDADRHLEYLIRIPRSRSTRENGFTVELVLRSALSMDLLVGVVAGDDYGQQIGASAADPPTRFRFESGEEVDVDVPITCVCNGFPGCAGTCADADPDCRPRPTSEVYCGDEFDNDGDGAQDCADSECWGRGPCSACGPEDCANLQDDDCDTAVDCADPDCRARSRCREIVPENCANGNDDDRDSLTDCFDPECAENTACTGPCTNPQAEICGNRRDDDCDRLIDCLDVEDCDRPAREMDCGDGFNDDCDAQTDCSDPDCYAECGCEATSSSEAALGWEACYDLVDQDCDGATDCDDPDCSSGALFELCSDGQDNDCDGRADCLDEDCPTDEEQCTGGFDEDCDGDIDCADTGCQGPVAESLCADDLDNDCDTHPDCDDEDCAAAVNCELEEARHR